MPEKATLTYGDKTVELPIIEGTEGERAIDIRLIFSEAIIIGWMTFSANGPVSFSLGTEYSSPGIV